MKVLVVGVGAGGNKSMIAAIKMGVVKEEDTILINSTSKDIPSEYNGEIVIISPDDHGCGKEINVARKYAIDSIKAGKLNIDRIREYDSVIVVTSTEGGTGSGSSPIIAQFFSEYYGRNTHIIAFTGFEEDVRGISNTIEFFKNMNDKLMIQAISNASFMREANNNKFKAEQLANEEMAKRIRILSGQDFIDSGQNIDDTDILKVSNTAGYMTVESIEIKKALVDQDDFNKYIKQMIYNSHSIKSDNPGAARIGVVLNLDEASEDAIDSRYLSIVETYGEPHEIFTQKQWDGNKEYIAIIVGGMRMPIEEVEKIYNHYKEKTEKVNKNMDSFFTKVQDMSINEEDKIFDMISAKSSREEVTIDSFLKNFE